MPAPHEAEQAAQLFHSVLQLGLGLGVGALQAWLLQTSVLLSAPQDCPPCIGLVVTVLMCFFTPPPHSALQEGPSSCQPEVTQSIGHPEEPEVSQARQLVLAQPLTTLTDVRH